MNQNLKRVILAVLTLGSAAVQAAEIGHFGAGVPNIRDFTVPEPGFYGLLYNYWYTSDRLNDAAGNELNSVTLGPRGGVTLDVNVEADIYALAPALIWVSPWKILGAKYGAYIAPTFGNTSVGASLVNQTGAARSADESQFAAGDMFVQALWLGWAQEHGDFAFGYGFYAPIGKYDVETITLPVIGPVPVEAADNIGLGFWTHQFQGAVSWYPWVDKRMSVALALTYEIHGNKEDFDLTPGQNLTLNWGVSQYLPLRKDQTLLEIGPAGYSSWQITDDSGRAAANPKVKDEVHAVGGQIGVTHLPWNATLNFRYLYEFDAKDRFQGESIGLNFAIKF